MTLNKIAVLTSEPDIVGESPIWSARYQALYWVDIKYPRLRKLDIASCSATNWDMPGLVGSLAFTDHDTLLVGVNTGLAAFDPDLRMFRYYAAPERRQSARRFNDGRCDRQGRFWVGAMSTITREPTGSLYRVAPDGSCDRFLDGLVLPNGVCWSPDSKTMYFADTGTSKIFAFDYDAQMGVPSAGRVFASTNGRPGRPDGATVDSEGYLWSAEYDGWCITRYAPDGRIDRQIELPVQRPTSCTFGGADFTTLFITTASQELTSSELSKQPAAGRVLAINAGVRGLPEPCFGGSPNQACLRPQPIQQFA